jgi:hypothetical protein
MMADISITTPKGGKTLGKIVPRQENSSLKTVGWSRTIIYWNHHNFFHDLVELCLLCQVLFNTAFPV